jgi:hypothetical protein
MRDAVRRGVVQAGLRLEKGVVGRTGSRRIGYGHTRLWSSVCKSTPRFHLRPKVLDEMLRRETTARDDLTGGETSRRLGNRPLLDNLKGFPRVAGLEGTPTRKGGDHRGEIDVGVGTATSARRRYAAGGTGALSGEEARERECEGVRLGARVRRLNDTA